MAEFAPGRATQGQGGREAVFGGGNRGRSAAFWIPLLFAIWVFAAFATSGRLELGAIAAVFLALLLWAYCRLRPPRTRLVWLGFLVPLLAFPDLVRGTPSTARLLIVLALSLMALLLPMRLEGLGGSRGEHRRHSTLRSVRNHDLLLIAGLVLYTLVTWAAISYKFSHFGQRYMPQDTAYFEQCIWSYLSGHGFFSGSILGGRGYDPPLESHFAMHFSPFLLVLAELYRLWSSYHFLHLMQVAAIAAAAIPVYLMARDCDRNAALLFACAYLCNAAVLSQTQLSFHVLALGAPVISFATYYFIRRRLRPFLLCVGLALCLREDFALVAIVAGLVSLFLPDFRGSRWRWVLSSLALGIGGWWLAGRVMAHFGQNGGDIILALFSRFGSSHAEIVKNILVNPGEVGRMLLEEQRFDYLLGLLRPGLLASLAEPASLLAVPALFINLLVRGAGTAWLQAHYSVYLPAVLMPASVAVWMRWTGRVSSWASAPEPATRATVASLMLVSALLSFPAVFSQSRLSSYLGAPYEDDIEALLERIPADAAVAVPRIVAPKLARRTELYLAESWSEYSSYAPEYVLVDTSDRWQDLASHRIPLYIKYLESFKGDSSFAVVERRGDFVLYRDRTREDVGRGGGRQ